MTQLLQDLLRGAQVAPLVVGPEVRPVAELGEEQVEAALAVGLAAELELSRTFGPVHQRVGSGRGFTRIGERAHGGAVAGQPLANLPISVAADPSQLQGGPPVNDPLVNIITHPANRLVGRDRGYALHFPGIYEAAAATGTALEIVRLFVGTAQAMSWTT